MATVTKKEFFRRWLGIDEDERQLKQWVESEFEAYNERLTTLEQRFSEIEQTATQLRNLLTDLKMPPNSRLRQLRSGLDILTSFANELQHDIEDAVAKHKLNL